MLEHAINLQINDVLKSLAVREDAIVLLCVDSGIEKRVVKPLLDSVLKYINQGTLCVIGDCSFNTSSSEISSLKSLSNRERLVLAADYTLQLLSLRQDCLLVKHPSISMGGVGKYAKYILRHQHLDFPYDKPSVFSDLVELNALYLCIGDVQPKYALKHAVYSNSGRVVKKESCVYNGELFSYLDFECDYDVLESKSKQLNTLKYYAEGPLDIYAGWYAEIISETGKSK